MTSRLRALLALVALLQQGDGWQKARPDYAWRFPRDHWSHPGYRSEWWYFTGQLRAVGRSADSAGASPDTAPRFGYQLTLFRVGIAPERQRLNSTWAAVDLVMGHAAITDFRTGRHRFSDVIVRATPVLGGFGVAPDSVLAWCLAPAGTPGRWNVRWQDGGFAFAAADRRQGFAFDLTTSPERPLVLEGPNGFSRKGGDSTNASQYYSFTRLATRGTLVLDGDTLAVRGRSWMDKELGSSQLAPGTQGWDWFSLQLADGRDVMVYLMRDSSGATAWGGATLVHADGSVRYLAAADVRVDVLTTWTDSAGTRYPARWRLAIPSERLELVVTPVTADQENRSAILTRLFYWEGAVRAEDTAGTPLGRGYVELVGYGKAIKPAI